MTKYELIIKVNAEEDIQSAFFWFEEQYSGLGKRFLDEVELILSYISKNPLAFEIRYQSVRIAFTETFSFGIHYVVLKSEIVIIAVLHTSASPLIWLSPKE